MSFIEIITTLIALLFAIGFLLLSIECAKSAQKNRELIYELELAAPILEWRLQSYEKCGGGPAGQGSMLGRRHEVLEQLRKEGRRVVHVDDYNHYIFIQVEPHAKS